MAASDYCETLLIDRPAVQNAVTGHGDPEDEASFQAVMHVGPREVLAFRQDGVDSDVEKV